MAVEFILASNLAAVLADLFGAELSVGPQLGIQPNAPFNSYTSAWAVLVNDR